MPFSEPPASTWVTSSLKCFSSASTFRSVLMTFSFLMSIPIILLAGGYLGLKLVVSGETVDVGFLLTGIITSFISAFICIHFFLILTE